MSRGQQFMVDLLFFSLMADGDLEPALKIAIMAKISVISDDDGDVIPSSGTNRISRDCDIK